MIKSENLLAITGAVAITAALPLIVELDHYARSAYRPNTTRYQAENLAREMDEAPMLRAAKARGINGSEVQELPIQVLRMGKHSLYGYIAYAASPDIANAGQELRIVMPYHGFFDTATPPANIGQNLKDHEIKLKNGMKLTLDTNSLYAKTDFELACYKTVLDLNQSEPVSSIRVAYASMPSDSKTTQFPMPIPASLLDMESNPLKLSIKGYLEKDEIRLREKKIEGTSTLPEILITVNGVYASSSKDTKAGDSGRLLVQDNGILGMLIAGHKSKASAEGHLQRKDPIFTSASNLATLVTNCIRNN